MGGSARDIRKLCPGAKVLLGLAIVGASVVSADREIGGWLKRAGLKA